MSIYTKLLTLSSYFFKLASGIVSTKYEAAKILEVPINASKEEIKKAYKIKVHKAHPDKSKSKDDYEIKVINSAYEVMMQDEPEYDSSPNQYTPDSPEYDYSPDFDLHQDPEYLSYEAIAEMRERMGRDEFKARFPGWENELKMEMGLDEWNKTFEHYDPKYEPGPEQWANEDYRWEYLESEIYDELSKVIEDLEDKIDRKDINKDLLADFLREKNLETLGNICDISKVESKIKHLEENSFVSREIIQATKGLIEDDLERIIKEIYFNKIFTKEEVLFGDFFSYKLGFDMLMKMNEKDFINILDVIKNDKNKIISVPNRWGGTDKLIDFTIPFRDSKFEDEKAKLLSHVIKNREKDKIRNFYTDYINS